MRFTIQAHGSRNYTGTRHGCDKQLVDSELHFFSLSHYLPQNSGPCNSFLCLYDDDDDDDACLLNVVETDRRQQTRDDNGSHFLTRDPLRFVDPLDP